MNRFFRSALFPLVVIVLLVWLASQTLIPHGKSTAKLHLSDFITAAKQGQVSNVEINPSKRSITYQNNSDKNVTVHYPADQSIPGSRTSSRSTASPTTRRARAASPG